MPTAMTMEDLSDPHDVPHYLPTMDELPSGASLARRNLKIGPRFLDLVVVFGSPPRRRTSTGPNAVIGSLAVGDWVPERNDACQWEPLARCRTEPDDRPERRGIRGAHEGPAC